MGTLTYTNTLTNGTTADASEVMDNFDDAKAVLNGNVDADNLADGAATAAKLAPFSSRAVASGDLSLSTSLQDVSGATVSWTPDVSSIALVTATFDFESQCASADNFLMEGILDVDGATQTSTATFRVGVDPAGGETITYRATVTQTWRISLTAAAHTLKLRAKYTLMNGANAGTHVAKQTNTSITVLGFAA